MLLGGKSGNDQFNKLEVVSRPWIQLNAWRSKRVQIFVTNPIVFPEKTGSIMRKQSQFQDNVLARETYQVWWNVIGKTLHGHVPDLSEPIIFPENSQFKNIFLARDPSNVKAVTKCNNMWKQTIKLYAHLKIYLTNLRMLW